MMTEKNENGFTLMEMMMVVVIIVVAAGVGGFSINSMMPDLRLKAAVRDLKSDLNASKLRAVRNNTLVSVAFDVNNDQYTIFQDDGAGGGNAGNGLQDGAEVLFKTTNLPPNINLNNAVFGVFGPFAQFDGRGISNVGAGRVALTNSRNDFRGVSVTIIGKVQVQISNDGGANWVEAFAH